MLSYISEKGRVSLKDYKYKGQDTSLIYQHIYTPMLNWTVKRLPMWLAPNVITLAGLALVVISHLLMLYYVPNCVGEAPWWVYILHAVLLMSYSGLDNLDGKQARRTKSSSPLGLLFDHGCDALNVSLTTLTLASTLQTGGTWKTFLLWSGGTIVFYFATWEEFHTGELILPIVNGPTEGLIVVSLLHVLTPVLGPSFWLKTSYWGMPNHMWPILFYGVGAALTLGTHILHALRAVHATKARHGCFKAVLRILPFLALMAGASVWVGASNENIMLRHPRLVVWTFGLLFCKLVMHLMLAHLAKESYNGYRKTLFPMAFIAAYVVLTLAHGKWPVIEESILMEQFFILAVVTYGHMVWGVCQEMTAALGIRVFVIAPQPDEPPAPRATDASLPPPFAAPVIPPLDLAALPATASVAGEAMGDVRCRTEPKQAD